MFSEGDQEAEEGDRAGRESQDAAPEVAVPFGRRAIVRRDAFAPPLLFSGSLSNYPDPLQSVQYLTHHLVRDTR